MGARAELQRAGRAAHVKATAGAETLGQDPARGPGKRGKAGGTAGGEAGSKTGQKGGRGQMTPGTDVGQEASDTGTQGMARRFYIFK